MTLRMDNGKTVALDPDKSRHIDYGYAVDGSHRVTADRVIATGEALDQKTLLAVPFKHRDLALYTSDGSELQNREENAIAVTRAAAIPEIQPQQFQRQQNDFGIGF